MTTRMRDVEYKHGNRSLLGLRVVPQNIRLHKAAPSHDMEQDFLPFVLVDFAVDNMAMIMLSGTQNVYKCPFDDLLFSSEDFVHLQKVIRNLF